MNQQQTKTKAKKHDFSTFIDNLIQRFEASPGTPLQINSLSHQSGVEKRRLYDLMNVLVACGVCTRRDTHTFTWNGISSFHIAMQSISKDIEEKALIQKHPNKLFLLPDSPSIGLIAVTFIAIYLYLGVHTYNIRDAAFLMSNGEESSKPILRRLYLVTFLLERIGILKHSQKIGEYSINEDIEAITQRTITNMQREEKFSPDSIEFQLSRFGNNYMESLYSKRQGVISRCMGIKTYLNQNNELMYLNSYNMHGIDA